MKQRSNFSVLFLLLLLVAVIGLAAASVYKATASDLSYSALAPQSNDDSLIAAHRAAVAQAPRLKSNVTASGTTSVSAAMFDRVVINTAGSADSQVILSDGTNAFATVKTASQAALTYYIALTSGTLKAITSGSTAPDITLTYR